MAALSSSSLCIRSRPVSFPCNKTPTTSNSLCFKTILFYDYHKRSPFRVSASISNSKARFVARRKESVTVRQLQRPLMEYMSLPASQYSVLDAERIERVDDNTFRCYVYRLKFFAFEVCPVLLVRVEEQPNGCCIKLLSCKEAHCNYGNTMGGAVFHFITPAPSFGTRGIQFEVDCIDNKSLYVIIIWRSSHDVFLLDCCQLEGSPIVVAQNDKFDASMVNRISCDSSNSDSAIQQLTSDAIIEVGIEIPFAFRPLPVQTIESTGTQVLEQLLKLMLPRFMAQLVKDYQAWATGNASRQPLGTGEI